MAAAAGSQNPSFSGWERWSERLKTKCGLVFVFIVSEIGSPKAMFKRVRMGLRHVKLGSAEVGGFSPNQCFGLLVGPDSCSLGFESITRFNF